MVKVSFVSNELPPYRIPLYEKLAKTPDLRFQFIFCTQREPNRHWTLPELDFEPHFLKERYIEKSGRFIHNNLDVFGSLHRFAPDIVITTGFNPTHLYAFSYAKAMSLPHIAMTDGTLDSEHGLGRVHRAVRQIVYRHSKAFIHASSGGEALYASYGVDMQRCFRSCLCIDNAQFAEGGYERNKQYDFIFCGRIEAVKNPLFALRVAIATARKLERKLSILFVGAGSEEDLLRQEAARHEHLVEASFRGFILHQDLPATYQAARLFLFPTQWDPWGVVLNEACAAGLPSIVSPRSGAAGELVQDGHNGYVCELDVNLWADKASLLLSNEALYAAFSHRSAMRVRDYNYDNAVAGIVAACRFADGQPRLRTAKPSWQPD